MRDAVRDTVTSWREELDRLGDRRDEVVERGLARAGLARREEVEDSRSAWPSSSTGCGCSSATTLA